MYPEKAMNALMPHQVEGVNFMAKKLRCLCTSVPGSGKSLTALAAHASTSERGLVVVAPAVALGVWVHETTKWLPEWTVRIQKTRKSVAPPGEREVLVTTYDRAELDPGRFHTLVCDEAHMIKNPSTKRSARLKKLAKSSGRVWTLTGTPILKDPMDLWNLLTFLGIERGSYGSIRVFQRMFGSYIDKRERRQWSKPRPLAWEPIKAWHFGHSRDEIGEMPNRFREQAYVEIPKKDQTAFALIAERYPDDSEDWEKWASGGELAQALAKLSLVKAAATAKLVKDFEPSTQNPIVLFSAHREAAEALSATLGYPMIVGGTPASERSKIVEEFQSGKHKGLVATIQAAGVGLTLTRARTMLFVSRTWTPALNSQAEDRCYRIGQKREVRVIDIRCGSDLEFAVDRVLKKKRPYLDPNNDRKKESLANKS